MCDFQATDNLTLAAYGIHNLLTKPFLVRSVERIDFSVVIAAIGITMRTLIIFSSKYQAEHFVGVQFQLNNIHLLNIKDKRAFWR